MSVSFMLGDALVRLTLGLLLKAGLSWREIIYVASGTAAGIYFATDP